jgi:hypothetical protein
MEKYDVKDLNHACTIHINACESVIDHCQKFIATCADNTDEIICAKEVGSLINVCTIAVRTGKNLVEVCQQLTRSEQAQEPHFALLKQCVPVTNQCVELCQSCADKARRLSDRSKKAALECIQGCTDSAQLCAEIIKR